MIVDSSKHPSTGAWSSRQVPGIDLHVVHLVRDSRGVAYSWTKSVTRPEVPDGSELMPRFRPFVAAAWWGFFNPRFPSHPNCSWARPPPSCATRGCSTTPADRDRSAGPRRGPRRWPTTTSASSHRTSVVLGPSHSVAGRPCVSSRGASAPAGRRRSGGPRLAGRARRRRDPRHRSRCLLAYGYLRATALDDGPARPLEVIVATRDRPELLRRAIRSILEQRYAGSIAITVVFDQAEPETDLEIDDEHRSVRVVTNARRPGLPGARNTGLTTTGADLVAFCDDDDLWMQGKVEAQVACLAENPAMEVVTTGLFVEAQGRVTTRVLDHPLITFRDLLRSRVMEAPPVDVPGTTATRSSMASALVDEDIPGGYGEDWDWLLRAARRADVGAVMLPLAKVFWHRSSYFAGRWQDIADSSDYLPSRSSPRFHSEPDGLAWVEALKAIALAALGQGAAARRQARVALGHDRRLPAGAGGDGHVHPVDLHRPGHAGAAVDRPRTLMIDATIVPGSRGERTATAPTPPLADDGCCPNTGRCCSCSPGSRCGGCWGPAT